MTTEQFVPYEMKTSIIHILSYDDKNLEGYPENAFFKGRRYFSNLTQMIFLVEELLDSMVFPPRATSMRSFTAGAAHRVRAGRAAGGEEKPIASFRLSVLFRQNASWQGNIQWMDDHAATPFRSVLELVQLMDSVLAQYDHAGGRTEKV